MSAPQKGNDATNARMERNATNARIKNNVANARIRNSATNARMKISVNQRSAAADPQNPFANILTTN